MITVTGVLSEELETTLDEDDSKVVVGVSTLLLDSIELVPIVSVEVNGQ